MSDTRNFESINSSNYPLATSQTLPNIDVLLHCGDLTQIGGLSAYKRALHLLFSFSAESKLVIAGNQDFSLDGEYWRDNLDEEAGYEAEEHERAVEIMTGRLAREARVTYLTRACTVLC